MLPAGWQRPRRDQGAQINNRDVLANFPPNFHPFSFVSGSIPSKFGCGLSGRAGSIYLSRSIYSALYGTCMCWPLPPWSQQQSIKRIIQLFSIREFSMLHENSLARGNLFEKLKHGYVIIGCWIVHWRVCTCCSSWCTLRHISQKIGPLSTETTFSPDIKGGLSRQVLL